ncbi:glycosyltransferase [Dysgonomonas sp. 25]|uniref:glycosyltransferase n=1 Tax=Dysgonomonas sp. 25 TaxID=2302933 RepID=UPI0013D8AA83|nr:glycosyltransferase [Dysgonomonas sp. 25]NDV67955.1 glycosyltransferase [Dysgonomonas sp. 25]
MKKKHIAFVVNGLYGGGAEKVLQVFLAHFDREKYDITLINHREDEMSYEYYPADIQYKSILKSIEKRKSKAGKLWVKIFNKINLFIYNHFSPTLFRRLYLRDKFDVEIAFIEGYATRIVSGGYSGRKIAWVHIDLNISPWTDIAFRSKEEQTTCYSSFDEVVSVSESVKESLEKLYSRQSIVIYNPIDVEEIREMSALYTVERDKKKLLFVSVGRLVPQKGYDRLIPIIGKLIAEGFDFRLWIVGEGAERIRLEKLIREWNLEEIVTLWGNQSNPYPYIAASDVFVCSSRSEGYSTAVTEALILGLPVVTTLCAGMEELLDGGEYGIIVENEDEALLKGMRNVLSDRKLMSRYADRIERDKNRFSLERQMNNIYQVIDNE